jgi:formiminotetrahydrofolate cyclodeaminase
MNESSAHFADTTLGAFTEALASRRSVPGGGAAAGSMLAHAAGLAEMVIAFSHGKKKFADFESTLAEAAGRLRGIRETALELADRDAHAFESLSALWPLEADDPRRLEGWPAAVEGAIEAPHRLVMHAAETVDLAARLVGRTSRLLRSDLAIAGRLAAVAAEAGRWNVEMNLDSLRGLDQGAARALAIENEVDTAIDHAVDTANRIDEACRLGGDRPIVD